MARREYQIMVVCPCGRRCRATAPALVREAGVPPRIAAAWARIRREMSPAGLKKKLRVSVN